MTPTGPSVVRETRRQDGWQPLAALSPVTLTKALRDNNKLLVEWEPLAERTCSCVSMWRSP